MLLRGKSIFSDNRRLSAWFLILHYSTVNNISYASVTYTILLPHRENYDERGSEIEAGGIRVYQVIWRGKVGN